LTEHAHDEVVPRFLVALFKVQILKEKLESKALEEREVIGKIGNELTEVIEAIASILARMSERAGLQIGSIKGRNGGVPNRPNTMIWSAVATAESLCRCLACKIRASPAPCGLYSRWRKAS
jgi:hypothetical protein